MILVKTIRMAIDVDPTGSAQRIEGALQCCASHPVTIGPAAKAHTASTSRFTVLIVLFFFDLKISLLRQNNQGTT